MPFLIFLIILFCRLIYLFIVGLFSVIFCGAAMFALAEDGGIQSILFSIVIFTYSISLIIIGFLPLSTFQNPPKYLLIWYGTLFSLFILGKLVISILMTIYAPSTT